jgi:hypothetical protein
MFLVGQLLRMVAVLRPPRLARTTGSVSLLAPELLISCCANVLITRPLVRRTLLWRRPTAPGPPAPMRSWRTMLSRVKVPLFSGAHVFVGWLSACTCGRGEGGLIRLGLWASVEKMCCTATHSAFSVTHTSLKRLVCDSGLFMHVLQRTTPTHPFQFG